MFTHNPPHRIQTETKCLPHRLGSKKRLKDASRKGRVDAHSVIPNLHKRHLPF